jgi:hypothetical protein
MAPIFLLLSVLTLAAGVDLMGLPGTAAVNFIISGGKGTQEIVFSKNYGYSFPILARQYPTVKKWMEARMGLKDSDALYHDNGSYQQALGN